MNKDPQNLNRGNDDETSDLIAKEIKKIDFALAVSGFVEKDLKLSEEGSKINKDKLMDSFKMVEEDYSVILNDLGDKIKKWQEMDTSKFNSKDYDNQSLWLDALNKKREEIMEKLKTLRHKVHSVS